MTFDNISHCNSKKIHQPSKEKLNYQEGIKINTGDPKKTPFQRVKEMIFRTKFIFNLVGFRKVKVPSTFFLYGT